MNWPISTTDRDQIVSAHKAEIRARVELVRENLLRIAFCERVLREHYGEVMRNG
jgi:hypothetical protein